MLAELLVLPRLLHAVESCQCFCNERCNWGQRASALNFDFDFDFGRAAAPADLSRSGAADGGLSPGTAAARLRSPAKSRKERHSERMSGLSSG